MQKYYSIHFNFTTELSFTTGIRGTGRSENWVGHYPDSPFGWPRMKTTFFKFGREEDWASPTGDPSNCGTMIGRGRVKIAVPQSPDSRSTTTFYVMTT